MHCTGHIFSHGASPAAFTTGLSIHHITEQQPNVHRNDWFSGCMERRGATSLLYTHGNMNECNHDTDLTTCEALPFKPTHTVHDVYCLCVALCAVFDLKTFPLSALGCRPYTLTFSWWGDITSVSSHHPHRPTRVYLWMHCGVNERLSFCRFVWV